MTEQVVLQLTDSCECALTVEYIADGRLVCDPNEPEKVIFQGRIISTSEKEQHRLPSNAEVVESE